MTTEGMDAFTKQVNTPAVEFYTTVCHAVAAAQSATVTVSQAAEDAVGQRPEKSAEQLGGAVSRAATQTSAAVTQLVSSPAPAVRIAGEAADRDWSGPAEKLISELTRIAEELTPDSIPAGEGDVTFNDQFAAAQDIATTARRHAVAALATFMEDAPLPNQVTSDAVHNAEACRELLATPETPEDVVDDVVVAVWESQKTGSADIREKIGAFSSLEGLRTEEVSVTAAHIATMFADLATTAHHAAASVTAAGEDTQRVNTATKSITEAWNQLAEKADRDSQEYLAVTDTGNLEKLNTTLAVLSERLTELSIIEARAQIRFMRMLPTTSQATADAIAILAEEMGK